MDHGYGDCVKKCAENQEPEQCKKDCSFEAWSACRVQKVEAGQNPSLASIDCNREVEAIKVKHEMKTE